MSLRTRITLAVAIVAGLGAGGYFVAAGEDDHAPRSHRWQSSQQCQACHAALYDEWTGSHHQIAYLNPEVRKLSDDFRNKECQACHLPRQIAVTGFGSRTLPRTTRPDEGVDCLSCHLAADGTIMGSRDIPAVPCAPHRDERFVTVALCESCHNQHQTTDQWRASSYAQDPDSCRDCHMPAVARVLQDGTTIKGRGHSFHGAHDFDSLRRAAEFDASVESGELVLTLRNVGAGHNFPTEERSRAVDIMYRFEAADGTRVGPVPGEDAGDGTGAGAVVNAEWTLAHRCRQPYRDEAGENTQLPAGESFTVRVDVPADAVAAQARLWYRLQPYVGDEHEASTLLFEREVKLR